MPACALCMCTVHTCNLIEMDGDSDDQYCFEEEDETDSNSDEIQNDSGLNAPETDTMSTSDNADKIQEDNDVQPNL